MTAYSQWFFADGWMLVTAVGASLGWAIGLRAYFVILPLVLFAIMGK